MSIASNPRVPSYRRHRPTGQAVVTLDGRDIYLGKWNSQASRLEYDRLICEWLTAGRCRSNAPGAGGLTIIELIAGYWQFVKQHYVKDGQPTDEQYCIKAALRQVKLLYGHTPAASFGPLAIKVVRERLIAAGLCRSTINSHIGRVRRMFRWAVAEELLPANSYQALAAVPGLQRGRCAAKEPRPIRPVGDTVVEATLHHLPPTVAAMVRLQRLTGCRPSEVCIMRPCDIDTSSEVWSYVPESHKTEHHDRERIIFIGPQAQAILRPFLVRAADDYCFVPAESERKRNAERRENRKSPLTPSQAARRPKSNRRRPPRKGYDNDSYRRAIARACDRAFPVPDGLPEEQRDQWRKSHRWAPNRLRHAAATEIRRRFGVEAARIALGHASAVTSELYAEIDFSKAVAIMRMIG